MLTGGTTSTGASFNPAHAWDVHARAPGSPAALHRSAFSVEVSAFRCPSDSVRAPVLNWLWDSTECWHGATNYRACTGDFSFGFMNEPEEMQNPRGAFWLAIEQDLGALTDGTSNTIIWSERSVVPEGGNRPAAVGGDNVERFRPVTYAQAGFGAWGSVNGVETGLTNTMLGAFTLGACLTTRSDAREYNSGSVARNSQLSGVSWWVGFPTQTLFTTITPPNGPSCSGWFAGVGGVGRAAAVAPTSFHTGGVNVGMGDGSVRFVSDTIDCGPSSARPVLTGPSQFGVWGALGSHNGGESIAVP